MERAERTGLSLALLGHIVLMAVLSLKLISDKSMPDIVAEPMTVDLVTDGGEPMSLPAPSPVPDQTPDGQAAPTTDAVPMPSEPTPQERAAAEAAEAARARADAAEAAAKAKASQEAAAAKAAAERAAAAALAARKSKDAATAKLSLQKAEAEAKAARDRAAAAKTAADKAARDKVARDAAAKAAAQKAAADKAARDKTARDAAAKAAKDKAARDAAARAAAEKARLDKLKNDQAKGKGGTGLGDLKIGQDDKSAGMTQGEARRAITISLGSAVAPRFKRCAPTGFDVELIETRVILNLNRDGSLASVETGAQTGINDSNRSQAGPLKDCAIKAVRAAAPFTNLPKDYYDEWKRWPMRLKTK